MPRELTKCASVPEAIEPQVKELALPVAERTADGEAYAAVMWQVMVLELLVDKGVVAADEVQQLLAKYETYAALISKVSPDLGKDFDHIARRLRQGLIAGDQ